MGINTNRIMWTIFKGLLIIAIALVAALQSCSAQSRKRNTPTTYLGFGASLGVRTKTLQSDFKAIDGMKVMQEGGTAIITGGNRLIRARLETGFYYSGSSVPHTVDLIELGASTNIYPLQFITNNSSRIEPYLTAGFTRGLQKFHGYYHMDETSKQRVNYSASREPYIGKTATSLATVGTGLEYQISDDYSFIHIFAEARYSKPVSAKNSQVMEQTSFASQMAVNVGVVFGMHR